MKFVRSMQVLVGVAVMSATAIGIAPGAQADIALVPGLESVGGSWEPQHDLGMCYRWKDPIASNIYKVDLRAVGAQRDPFGPTYVINQQNVGYAGNPALACVAGGLARAVGEANYVVIISLKVGASYTAVAEDDNACVQDYHILATICLKGGSI